ncbi:hypothetical protein BS17DRAFT_776731 [Gyrodon lividus]|nr:hypothetical protein BS17DRAFT_776731 [Gyrodon lividus]
MYCCPVSFQQIFPYYPYRSERLNVPNHYCFPGVEQCRAPEAGSSGSQRT